MLLTFQKHLQEHFPKLQKAKVLIAISGGVDSVVLTILCENLGMDVTLAHCNFRLRDAESDADEKFILELADALELKVFIEHFDTLAFAAEKKISVQMAARELRYQWFRELRETQAIDYVLTGHHANDNLETFLINFLRGTGIEGLTGIPARNGHILRPLLPFSRKSIEEFARQNNLVWREDSSNSSTKYLRNKIRKEVIPLLEEINPQLLDQFNLTQKHLKESADLVEAYISAIFSRVAKETRFGYSFDIKLLKTLPNLKAVLYELFKSFGFSAWDDIFELLDAQPGKMVVSGTHRLIKDREELLLTKIPSADLEAYHIPKGEEFMMFPMGSFHFEEVENISEANSNSIFVAKEKLQFPLVVRKWEKGDYFCPFGMQGKKKLSKFFKDKKLSLPDKENCWLLCSKKNEIVWVIGHRADSRFSVDKNTAEILKITYTS